LSKKLRIAIIEAHDSCELGAIASFMLYDLAHILTLPNKNGSIAPLS
jgi:hypothetical protein